MKPKLTLRDLFWLVLVAGLGLGWWLDRSQLKQAYAEIAKEYTGCFLEAEAMRGWVREIWSDTPPHRPIGQKLAAEATKDWEAPYPPAR